MHYLTVQDMLWIHLQVTKRTAQFKFDALEEATYYQYGYGSSNEIIKQAARFATGFAKKAPLGDADSVCAFIGALAFLELNGMHLNLTDECGLSFAARCASGAAEAEISQVANVSADHAHSHDPDIRGIVSNIIRRFPKTISGLVDQPSVI